MAPKTIKYSYFNALLINKRHNLAVTQIQNFRITFYMNIYFGKTQNCLLNDNNNLIQVLKKVKYKRLSKVIVCKD